jgi:hypothetical protein
LVRDIVFQVKCIGAGLNEKSSSDTSEELSICWNIIVEALNLTYLSRLCGLELAPYSSDCMQSEAGCQGFIGPYPSAFLDKTM